MSTLAITNSFTAGTTIVASQMNTNFTDVTTFLNTTGVNVYQAASVGGAALAADVCALEKTIFQTNFAIAGGSAAGTYWFDAATTGGKNVASGTAGPTNNAFCFVMLNSADYLVAGRTTKLQVRVSLAANATAVGTVTLTFGLYPITVAGAAFVINPTLGSVTSGSTAAFVTPAASTAATAASGVFTLPANGAYVLGCTTSVNTTAANSQVAGTIQLQMGHA